MATAYEGGAGGKIRRNAFKKAQSTPYDRPPTALRGNPSWVSKMIVDPASKLVTAGAHLFFSSFRKRLTNTPPPPPLPPGESQEAKATFQETVQLSHAGGQRPTLDDSGKKTMTNENGGLFELELMLKQKTFTRSEFDRLTELLQSRTVESSTADKERTANFQIPETAGSQRHGSFERSSLLDTRNDNNLDSHRSHEQVQTDVVSSKVLEENVATPVELAKAYMGKKSSTVSPSLAVLRSQSVREDSVPLCNSPFAPRSPVMSLVQNPSTHGGLLENGFCTPRSRGRSSIYSMARTPYSRNNPTASHKGIGSIYDGYGGGGSSASPSTGFARELVSRSVSKDMALKRRSSVLEDEIGSVGPIRRLRQKTNLSTPKNTSLPIARAPFSNLRTGITTNGTLDLSSSFKTSQGNNNNENISGTSYTPVPAQSKETARKILEQLEKLTPKEKQDKVVALREIAPSQRNNKVEENGQNSSNDNNGSLAPAETDNRTILIKDTVPPFSFSDLVKKQSVPQSSQKKWGFQMSAQEDLLEQDASTKYDEKKKTLETIGVNSKSVSVTGEKAPVSELKVPTALFGFRKSTDLITNDDIIFSPVTPATSTSLSQVVSISQATTFTNNVSDKEPNAPHPLFSFGTKNADKVSPFTVPSSPFANGSLGVKSTAPTDVKQDTTNSLATNSSNATETVLKLAESVNGVVENTQNPGNTVEKQEKSSFLLPQSGSGSSIFTFGSKPSFSSVGNGSFNSTTPSTFSPPVPVLPACNLENQTPSPFTISSFSTANSTAVSTGDTPSTSATSSSIFAPVFKFGPTPNSTPATSTTPLFVAPPTYSTVSTTSKETNVGNLSSITPFSATSPPLAGTGSSIFGFSACSTSLSTATIIPSVSLSTSISSGQNTSSSNFSLGNNNSTSSSSLFSSLTPVSSPFGLSISAPSPTVFSFSAQTPASGLSTVATSLPVSPFCFTSAAKTENYTGGPTSPEKGGDQNTMVEDSMAEDVVQVASTHAPAPSFAVFGEPPVSNLSPSPFMFGSTVPPSSTGTNLFQFGGQQSQPSLQNPNPFQPNGQNPNSFGQQNQPGLQNPNPFGQQNQPSVQNPNPFGQQNPNLFGQQSQAGLQNPNPFGQQSQAGLQNPNPFGQQSQPGLQNPNPFGQQSQPGIQNPNPFGQQSQPGIHNTNPFGQQSQLGLQNPNPFDPSGSQDLGGGGSFSLGSGGGEKSGRRFIKVKRKTGKK